MKTCYMVAQNGSLCPRVAPRLRVYSSSGPVSAGQRHRAPEARCRHDNKFSGLSSRVSLRRGLRLRRCPVCRVGPELIEPLQPLGVDFLKFLAAFVVITPVFRKFDASPILGFLLAGLLLRQMKYEPCLPSPCHIGPQVQSHVISVR